MADLTPFLEKHPFTFDIALADDEAVHIFGQGYPRHVVIDGDGKSRLRCPWLQSRYY